MLRYFIEKKSIQDIEDICAAINRIKRQIKTEIFLPHIKNMILVQNF
jgi:hypothetical protein